MSFAPEEIEAARKIFAGPITFLKSAPTLEFLPDASVNEVAFAGRSNVGKSSLINSLLLRKGLARTSNTPGRTQSVNFFLINDEFYFIIIFSCTTLALGLWIIYIKHHSNKKLLEKNKVT